jgi:DNA-binding NarL/FixJ family response regulator
MHERQIRVLIVDDQQIFLEGLEYVLRARAPDIDIVGTALSGEEAVEAVRKLRPDIVLMDVRMPDMDGVEATRLIHHEHPETKIVMLTTFGDDQYVQSALGGGAIGYLLKNRPPIELINSIRAVRDGIFQIDPTVAARLFKRDVADMPVREEIPKVLRSFTRREKEVLSLVLMGMDNRQIAAQLNISEQTTRNYISTIYSKLGITNRLQIVRITGKLRYYLEQRDVQ